MILYNEVTELFGDCETKIGIYSPPHISGSLAVSKAIKEKPDLEREKQFIIKWIKFNFYENEQSDF